MVQAAYSPVVQTASLYVAVQNPSNTGSSVANSVEFMVYFND